MSPALILQAKPAGMPQTALGPVDDDELEKRRKDFESLPPRYTRGVLAKYAKLVGSASRGAVCD